MTKNPNWNSRISLLNVDLVFNGAEGGEEGWRSHIPEDFLYLLKAIDNCLDCELWEDAEGQALDPQILRSRIYQEVVRPLELHLTHGFKNIPLDGVDKHAREINFAQWGQVINNKEPEDLVTALSPGMATPERLQPPTHIPLGQGIVSQIEPFLAGLGYWHQQLLALYPKLNLSLKLSPGVTINSAQFFDDEIGHPEGTSKYEDWKSRHQDIYKKFIKSHVQSSPSTPVKIAILDTGIDEDHPIFDAYGELKGKINFYDESRKKKVPDGNGHGTFAASLILDYAPDADLYVIKISGKDNARPDAHVVIKAIDHAVNVWHVDIISMSFGWPSSDFDGYNELQDAIDRAYNKQVLMFAAASNSVGESVQSAWPTFLCDDVPGQSYLVSRSGTSYATPILVGIVAFLLQYARLHLPKSAAAMKRKENIEALLKRCAERGLNYEPRDGYFKCQELFDASDSATVGTIPADIQQWYVNIPVYLDVYAVQTKTLGLLADTGWHFDVWS
ncbi:hypothetical protein EsH8_V_000957 [Colletotrichum jinshuiense]